MNFKFDISKIKYFFYYCNINSFTIIISHLKIKVKLKKVKKLTIVLFTENLNGRL